MGIYDVIRLLVDAARAVGGITEQQHTDAHAGIDAADDGATSSRAKPTFSDVEQAELDRLLAAKEAAEGTAAEAEPVAPPVVPVPGAGFHQEPA